MAAFTETSPMIALLIPGIAGAGALGGWTIDSIIQGILVTGAAVYGNQLYKQGGYALAPKENDEPE
ncbi:MAG: phage holin family protein [Christensenellales bacterium]|jgi:hypothetical protein